MRIRIGGWWAPQCGLWGYLRSELKSEKPTLSLFGDK